MERFKNYIKKLLISSSILILCNCSGFESQNTLNIAKNLQTDTSNSHNGNNSESKDQDSSSSQTSNPTSSKNNILENPVSQGLSPSLLKLNCQYYEANNISESLKQILNISFGDVAVLDENGIQAQNCGPDGTGACYYLYENQVVLGNKGLGIKQDTTCSASKFRLSTEVYINACVQSLSLEENRKKLFPQGLSNFDKIYQSFLGRYPSSLENQILKNLSDKLSGESNKMSGICAAIGASMEANLVI